MSAPPPYLLALRLAGERCLVVGGGRVAARKIASLVEAGAIVTVVAPVTRREVDDLAAEIVRRPYRAGDVAGYRLAIAATGLPDIDATVFADAESAGVLVNAADDPASCRFFVPALLRRGAISIAVSTGGASPYLASWLRRRLEDAVGPEFAAVAELLADTRRQIRAAGIPTEGLAWGDLLDDELVATVASGHLDTARARADSWLSAQLAAVPA